MRYGLIDYTLSTPYETLEFDPTGNLFIEACEFSAAVAAARTKRPQSHGALQYPGTKDGGIWNAQARLLGAGGSIETQRSALVAALNDIVDEQGTLEWTNPGAANALQLTGLQLLEDVAFARDGGTLLAQFQLGSEKPCAEDAEATVVDSAALSTGGGGFSIPLTIPFEIVASSGGDLVVTHDGDFKYAYPVLRSYGPAINPVLINHTVGERLVFEGSIAAGDYWEIDLFAKSVKLNGVSSIRALDSSQSTWWKCVRGANALQFSCSGYTTTTFLRAFMRSSWG